MSTITIDIETLPDLTPGVREEFIEAARENIKVPSGATKDTLAADLGIFDKDIIKAMSRADLDAGWLAEVGPKHAEALGDAEWRKTSFSGLSGQLLMIGVGIDDEAPIVLHGDEPLILFDFASLLADVQKRNHMGLPMFVGHNLIDFDLPFIFHRSVMLEIAPHITFPVAPSRYSERIYDTMSKWAGFGNRIKLDTLARALGAGGVSSQRITHPGGIERGMREVASQYAHRMALSLECILLDYSGKWSGEAVRVLSEYRDAMSAIHESDSPTYMGEPICATLPTL